MISSLTLDQHYVAQPSKLPSERKRFANIPIEDLTAGLTDDDIDALDRADMAIIRNAAALLAKGDHKTAAKVLFSFGTAPRTKATADALQKLQVRVRAIAIYIAAFDTPALPDDINQVDSNFSISDLYKCNLKKSCS
jgi:hypothetical protein